MTDKPGLMAVYLTDEMLAGFEDVIFNKKNKYFSFLRPKLNFEGNYLPEGFWKIVRRQYFNLKDEKYSEVKNFLKQVGSLSSEKFNNYKTNNPGVFSEEVDRGKLEIEMLKKALEWFNTLLILWKNGIKGKGRSIRIIKEHLGNEIPKGGFKPFLSVHSLRSLPENKEKLIKFTLQFVSKEFASYLGNIILKPVFEEGEITPAWRYEPKDWMDAAMINFYLEMILPKEKCACGCGFPAKSGSKYYNEKHKERVKKRNYREKYPYRKVKREIVYDLIKNKTTIQEVIKNNKWPLNGSEKEIKEDLKKFIENDYTPQKGGRYERLLKKYKENVSWLS